MERSWMYNLSKLDPSYSYRLKIYRFIDAAKRHACRENMKHIYCPCIDCKNIDVFDDIEEIILIWFVEFFLLFGAGEPITLRSFVKAQWAENPPNFACALQNQHVMFLADMFLPCSALEVGGAFCFLFMFMLSLPPVQVLALVRFYLIRSKLSIYILYSARTFL
jgi:hypothetical protein